MTRDERKNRIISRYIGGIVVIAIICGFILLIVKILIKWKCEKIKEEGLPNYAFKDC